MRCCSAGRARPASASNGLRVDSRPPGRDEVKKVVIIGNSGVGKTALLSRIRSPDFDLPVPTSQATIGVDYFTPQAASPIGRLMFWDTAGQERFRAILSSYYRSAYCVILVFSLVDVASYLALQQWVEDADKYSTQVMRDPGTPEHKVSFVVLGTKADLISEPELPKISLGGMSEFLGREIDYYGEMSSVDGRGFPGFLKAMAELARTGDIVETRTPEMDELGIKLWAREAAAKARAERRRKRKEAIAELTAETEQPASESVVVENPLPIVTE